MDKKCIEDIIVKVIKKEVKPQNNITVDTNLGKLGFNSMDVVEMVISLEDAFNINIASDEHDIFDDILKKDTVHELADYIVNKLNKKK